MKLKYEDNFSLNWIDVSKLRNMSELFLGEKCDVSLPTRGRFSKDALQRLLETHITILGIGDILHQDAVSVFCPQGWDETQVVAQLATSMRSREITEI